VKNAQFFVGFSEFLCVYAQDWGNLPRTTRTNTNFSFDVLIFYLRNLWFLSDFFWQ